MLFPRIPGEPPDARIVRIMRSYAGCSLSSRRNELAALVEAAGPRGCVAWETNCATFALGVLRAACGELDDARSVHALLAQPIPPQKAFTWLVQIGADRKAWRDERIAGPPVPGAIMWYEIDGKNDDHAEIRLTAEGEHGGAGRANNAVTIGYGDVDHSAGRPIHLWMDPFALGIVWIPVDAGLVVPAAPTTATGMADEDEGPEAA